jgi:hypothetical protein
MRNSRHTKTKEGNLSPGKLGSEATEGFIPFDKRKNPVKAFATFTPIGAPTRKATKRNAGQNDFEDDFLWAANVIKNNYASFQLSDFFALLSAKNVPPDETRQLFNSWIDGQVQLGTVKEIRGCYEVPVYQCK